MEKQQRELIVCELKKATGIIDPICAIIEKYAAKGICVLITGIGMPSLDSYFGQFSTFLDLMKMIREKHNIRLGQQRIAWKCDKDFKQLDMTSSELDVLLLTDNLPYTDDVYKAILILRRECKTDPQIE